MNTFTVEAIILRTDDFGDANRVVTLFSKEFGKLEANAYGCRRSRSPLSGALQMFNHVSATLTRGAKVDIIREADIINFYDALTKDLERLAYASLLFEIVNRMTLPRQRELATFNLLTDALPTLSRRNPRIAALIGACQFMETSGVQLSFSRCVHCGKNIVGDAAVSLLDGGAVCLNCRDAAQSCRPYPEGLRRTFETMLGFDWRDDTKLTFNSRQVAAAENFFLEYVHGLLGNALKSVQFIRELESLRA